MDDHLERDHRGSANLIKLLEDSEKRYGYVHRSLEGAKIRNRQLSISLNKEKEDRLRIKTALNVAREKADENRICLNRNIEKVSRLEDEVDELREEKTELSELLESEKERGQLLGGELELFRSTETLYSGISAPEDVVDLTKEGETENENMLQDLVLKLKTKLDMKETECNELEDKLVVMQQELFCRGDHQATADAEFERRLSTLHDIVAKERHLNSFLSEESDKRFREMQTQLQQKDELNTDLQDIRDQASERMVCVEEQCRFYRTKLADTEEQLNVIYNGHEQSIKRKESVSCQVYECDLAPEGLSSNSRLQVQDETVYHMFNELWSKENKSMGRFGNNTRYKMNIIKLLQNGFKHLTGNTSIEHQNVAII